jgi:hypothetical protein
MTFKAHIPSLDGSTGPAIRSLEDSGMNGHSERLGSKWIAAIELIS